MDEAGRATLTRAGADVASFSRPGSATMRVYSTQSPDPFFMHATPPALKRWVKTDPETNRHAMREALLGSLEAASAASPSTPAQVHFERGACDVVPAGAGPGALLVDSDGNELGQYDVVVDASGMSSKLRRRRVPTHDLASTYTGITMLHGVIPDPEATVDPEVVYRLGQGTLTVIGDRADGKGIVNLFLQRFGSKLEDKRTTLGMMVVRPGMGDLSRELCVAASTRFIAEDTDGLARVKQWILGEMGSRWASMWHTCIHSLARVAVRPLVQFPSSPPLDTQSTLPLICIGDALHAMPPYTGSGGNLALEDAGDIATFLIEWATKADAAPMHRTADLVAGLRALEQAMLKRSAGPAKGGEVTRARLLSLAQQQEVMREFSLAKFVRGAGPWSVGSAAVYAVCSLLMRVHKRYGYYLPPRAT